MQIPRFKSVSSLPVVWVPVVTLKSVKKLLKKKAAKKSLLLLKALPCFRYCRDGWRYWYRCGCCCRRNCEKPRRAHHWCCNQAIQIRGRKRQKNAVEGINELIDKVDSLVTIPNDRLLEIASKEMTMKEAFEYADDVLRQGVQGIADTITKNAVMINLDFADVRSTMQNTGPRSWALVLVRVKTVPLLLRKAAIFFSIA